MSDVAGTSRILTLVFTDLADSTALKTERGDQAVGELIARHRAHVRRLAADAGGRIIDWAGDGCFLTFETPSAAVPASRANPTKRLRFIWLILLRTCTKDQRPTGASIQFPGAQRSRFLSAAADTVFRLHSSGGLCRVIDTRLAGRACRPRHPQ